MDSLSRALTFHGINIEEVPKTKRRAPDKIGNVNKSIPPVIKRDQGNNGIVFNDR